MENVNIIIAAVAILLGIILYIKKVTYGYWKKRGVPYIEPDFFYGNAKKWVKGEVSRGDIYRDFYRVFKRRGVRHGGIYMLLKPVYVPIDPELIKCILVKDFDNFVNRGALVVNEKADPLSGHLFNLENARWKNLRAKLTPTFTSGKMKMMFQTLVGCSEELEKLLDEHTLVQDPVDIKEILARFTTDIIGSCAFGIDCNSLKDPDSKFRAIGKKIFTITDIGTYKRIITTIFPLSILSLMQYLKPAKPYYEFFINLVNQTIEYRQKNNVHRKDFMHLLLELKNKGRVEEGESVGDIKENNGKQANFMSTNEIAAQCFVFFLAGFETSSTTMSFALYELAINQNVQDRLREEIRSVLKKYDNKLTYDSIMEMTYLDKVINETLRMHSPAYTIQRVCNKAYRIPNTDVILEPGMKVVVPIYGLHSDPEYYPNPEVFDPERFSEENKAKRPNITFIPFGEGPRICIGLRFGIMQSKVGLVKVLENYRVTLNNKTQIPLEVDPNGFVTTAKGGIWLNITKIDENK